MILFVRYFFKEFYVNKFLGDLNVNVIRILLDEIIWIKNLYYLIGNDGIKLKDEI